MSTEVTITVGGVDVSNNVIYSSASFESQQNAVPGTFEFTVKDPDRTLGPWTTGDEVVLELGGVRHYAGYLTQVTSRWAFPADELPSDSRQWVMRGVDYNILFDKRVTRNVFDYLRHLPTFTGADYDGDLIKFFCANFLDLPAGFNSTTYVDNVALPFWLESVDGDRVGGWKQQGTPWREQMELMNQWSGAVFYIDPQLRLHYHAIENDVAPFGFSDNPNGTTTIGPRDVTATERGGPQMTNDAFVWGGSEWTEDVIFARAQNATAISNHGRWQKAEHHFGEDSFKVQTGVTGRANMIVNGSPSALLGGFEGFNPGEAFPQWDLNLTWDGHKMPPGQQIRAGQLVDVYLSTFGGELNPITLPMRSIRINFIGLDGDSGEGYVRFTGSLGLALSDPFSIWAHLRKLRRERTPVLATSNNNSGPTTYGALGQFTPVQVSSTLYDLPGDIAYIAGTTQVYKDGLLLRRDVDYTETDPVAGTITFSTAPGGAALWVVCRTA